MDTIGRHCRRLVQLYEPSPASAEVNRSAKELASAVLANDRLMLKHKRKILSEVQWLISEADGKYSTRYRTKRVVELAEQVIEQRASPSANEKVQHEHVIARRDITAELLANPANVAGILDRVIACVVTKAEHDRLRGPARGWRRYRDAGIEVYDMSVIPPRVLDLAKASGLEA